MTSVLRSTSVTSGYFVMSAESLIDGSGAELFIKVGDNYVYDNSLASSLVAGSTFTFRDLGLTVYSATLTGATGSGPVDLRKVQLVSGLTGGVAGTAFDGVARYVPLGTNLKSSTPFEPASIKSSVFLAGKIL